VQITCGALLIDMKIIVFGTNQGTIRSYLWPIDLSCDNPAFFEIAAHSEPVSALALTPD